METEDEPLWAYILGIDPGTTTGISLVRYDLPNGGAPMIVNAKQADWDAAAELVTETIRILGANDFSVRAIIPLVTCEKFTINAHTAQRGQQGAEDALGMNGIARKACSDAGVELAKLEQASAAKNLVTDQVLKALGIHMRGERHINDATRHSVLQAVKRKYLDPKRLVGG